MADADSIVAALKRERYGYVTRGLDERVRQVDEQLALYGVTVEDDKSSAEESDAGPTRTIGRGKSRKAISDGE